MRWTNVLDYFALYSCIAVSCMDNTPAPKTLSDISFRHNLKDPTDYIYRLCFTNKRAIHPFTFVTLFNYYRTFSPLLIGEKSCDINVCFNGPDKDQQLVKETEKITANACLQQGQLILTAMTYL